jgi:Holliday junction resolvase RusA-like endonuclease
MAMHIEFVLPGPPISNQQNTLAGKANLVMWHAVTARTVGHLWGNRTILTRELKAVIINFFAGSKPSVDVDGMSKPILDEMKKVVYENDRQIRQAKISHVRIDAAFSIIGVSKVLVDAIRAGSQFGYTRIEDPVDPFPLPK